MGRRLGRVGALAAGARHARALRHRLARGAGRGARGRRPPGLLGVRRSRRTPRRGWSPCSTGSACTRPSTARTSRPSARPPGRAGWPSSSWACRCPRRRRRSWRRLGRARARDPDRDPRPRPRRPRPRRSRRAVHVPRGGARGLARRARAGRDRHPRRRRLPAAAGPRPGDRDAARWTRSAARRSARARRWRPTRAWRVEAATTLEVPGRALTAAEREELTDDAPPSGPRRRSCHAPAPCRSARCHPLPRERPAAASARHAEVGGDRRPDLFPRALDRHRRVVGQRADAVAVDQRQQAVDRPVGVGRRGTRRSPRPRRSSRRTTRACARTGCAAVGRSSGRRAACSHSSTHSIQSSRSAPGAGRHWSIIVRSRAAAGAGSSSGPMRIVPASS